MIKLEGHEITMSGSTSDLCAEVTAILHALREELIKIEGEMHAELLMNEILRIGGMSKETARAYMEEKQKHFKK